jgi:hypothetical protein
MNKMHTRSATRKLNLSMILNLTRVPMSTYHQPHLRLPACASHSSDSSTQPDETQPVRNDNLVSTANESDEEPAAIAVAIKQQYLVKRKKPINKVDRPRKQKIKKLSKPKVTNNCDSFVTME